MNGLRVGVCTFYSSHFFIIIQNVWLLWQWKLSQDHLDKYAEELKYFKGVIFLFISFSGWWSNIFMHYILMISIVFIHGTS